MNRNEILGRFLGLSDVLADRVYGESEFLPSVKYMKDYANKPAKFLPVIHRDLIAQQHKFGDEEWALFHALTDVLSQLPTEDFTDDPVDPVYLHYHSKQKVDFGDVIGVEEASEKWGLAPGTIKNYCAQGKIKAKKIGKTWVIDGNQMLPDRLKL